MEHDMDMSMDMPMPMPGHDGGHGGGGGGHQEHGTPMMKCSMAMTWNTATSGMCIVFPSWHVTGPHSFIWTLAALFCIAATLEYLRFKIRSLDANLIAVHRLSNGILGSLTGSGPSLRRRRGSDHRRKASIQSIVGRSHSPTLQKSNGGSLGGPTLSTTATGLSIGERRVSPSHTPSDTASFGSRSDDDAPLLPGAYNRSRKHQPALALRLYHAFIPRLPISRRAQLHRAMLYVLSLAFSVFLMLVFMTYNAWMIGAVVLGAGTGHYLFNRDIGLGLVTDDKTACH